MIGGLGYYFYQAKKQEVNVVPPQQPSHPQTNKLKWSKSLLYYKMDKCFRSWLLNAGKEDIENGSSEHLEI